MHVDCAWLLPKSGGYDMHMAAASTDESRAAAAVKELPCLKQAGRQRSVRPNAAAVLTVFGD